MRLLSPILQRVVYPALGRTGYFHARAGSSVSVVTYHGVVPEGYRSKDAFIDNTLVNAECFRSHLRLLKKHYNVVSPEHFLRWLREQDALPKRAVLLTCDDGLLNNLTTMLPLLKEQDLHCLFFVTGESAAEASEILWYVELYLMLMEASGESSQISWRGSVIPEVPSDPVRRRSLWLQLLPVLSRFDEEGRREFLREAVGWWNLDPNWKRRYLEDPILRQRFCLLRAPELKQLATAGTAIGAHTMSHPVLSEQPDGLAQGEIVECRRRLESASGQSVWALAYPFGDQTSVGTREFHFAEQAGYECAFVNVGGSVPHKFSRFSLPRIHVTAEMTLPVYEAHVSGFHDALQRRFRGR